MRTPWVMALGVLLIVLPNAANAISITENVADFTSNPGPTINLTPTSSSLWSIQTVSVGGLYRSPFENFTPAGSQGPGYGNSFASIQLGGSALYNFAGPRNWFSILWGSPDAYNSLSFYSGINGTGSLLLSLTGTNLLIQTFGHDLVQVDFGNQFFQSLVLTTSSNAFEYTNLHSDITGAPLPAALPLFATGLGALGLLGWWRKRKAT
jgi:hypothetical protein